MPEVQSNLGAALRAQGKSTKPSPPIARPSASSRTTSGLTSTGNAFKDQGELDVAAYRQAISIKPDYVRAHLNLGNALKDQRKLGDAIAAYRVAIGINPDYAEVHSNLGNALREEGKLDEAIAAYRPAISIRPGLRGSL
jgi:tetratricopeptide (TPR) repeat protein